MNLLFLLLLILTFLIFVPIPFKLNIHFSLYDYYIKLYGFSLISKEKLNIKKNKSTILKKSPPFKEKKISLLNKLKKIDFKAFVSDLYKRRYKPTLYLDISLNYSLTDASKTALLYGALNNLTTPIYILLNIIFKFKKYNIQIKPLFKDEYFLDFDADSIFFLSLAEIIFIISILFKYMHNYKEVAP